MSEISLLAGNVKAAMREAGAPSSDLWMVPIENIHEIEGFNVRQEGATRDVRIAELGEMILANGFRKDKPLSGFVAKEGESNVIYLTDGHTRLRAVHYANERGAEIKALPVVTSPAGTSMEDLTVGLVVSNSGAQLTPLEKAMVCKRLIGYGMEEADIAKRLGFTKAYVQDLLLLVGSSAQIRNMVASNEVSASSAVSAVKKHGKDAAKVLSGAVATAKASGKTKATKKTIEPKTPKPEPDSWVTDKDSILQAIRHAGFVLMKTANGYELGPLIHGVTTAETEATA